MPRYIFVALAGLLFLTPATAQVRVVKSAASKTGIDVTGFSAAGAQGAIFERTLYADLERSGWFRRVGHGQGEVRLLGSGEERGGDLHVKCSVYGTASQRSFLSKKYRMAAAEARTLAHQVADEIVEAVSGHKGIASTRIAMIGTRSGQKELYVCDPDGKNLVRLTRDKTVSVRPRWGPKGDRLVYTSYLKQFPDVYLIELATGRRTQLSSQPGLNTGAAISPNGREMALILSKDGNPELYVQSMSGGRLTRITRTRRAGEAGPSWSPDGRSIVYVSDQSGTPQLYVISREGGRPQRLTRRGSENVAPDWGPNGRIAFSTRIGGKYHVAVIDPNRAEVKQISRDWADYEDPSWAPDGRHIVASRTENYRSSVYILDTLGDPSIRLLDQSGDWYSPAWSPE